MNIVAFDLGCEPASVPDETVLQNGWVTFLLFFAVSKQLNAEGHVTDVGVAVVECEGCSVSKFGYPNDEGLKEH
jgi:hypothetical protein